MEKKQISKKKSKISELSWIEIISILRKASIQNKYFIFLFFFLKLIGMIIISHSKLNIENTESSIGSYLTYLTFYGALKIKYLGSFNYNYLSVSIFFIMILPYSILFFIHHNIKEKNFSNFKLPKIYKRILRIISYLFTLITFISQYLIEILFFVILNAYVMNIRNSRPIKSSDSIEDLKDQYVNFFIGFNSSLILGNYIFVLILNVISIILINFTVYNYFKYNNEPFLNSTSKIKFICNELTFYVLIFIFNFQGFHYFSKPFIGDSRFNINLTFKIMVFTTNILYLILSLNKFNFDIFFNELIDFVNICSLVSLTLNFLINMLQNGSENLYLNIFYKFFYEVFLGLIIYVTIRYIKAKILNNILRKNIFSKNNKNTVNSLIYFSSEILKMKKNSSNFYSIFSIINEHIFKCKNPSCFCKQHDYLKIENFSNDNIIDIENNNFTQNKFNTIILLLENEIINTINQSHKENLKLDTKIYLIHVEIIFLLKNNYFFANYLIDKYSNFLYKMPFMNKYHFHLYKSKIVKFYRKKIKDANTDKKFLHFSNFYIYHKLMEDINKLILKNCENFIRLIYFKNTFENNLEENLKLDKGIGIDGNTINLFSKVENIFVSCEKLNKHLDKITLVLEENFKNEQLQNREVCYLLYNFFMLIDQEEKIKNYFMTIDDYQTLEHYDTSYDEKKMNHPIILNTNKKDKFIIDYVGDKFCEIIDYDKSNLKGKDIQILLPEEFREEHAAIMKRVIFLENKSNVLKKTFLITENNFYIDINVFAIFIPTMKDQIMIIMDVTPIENKVSKKINFYECIMDSYTNIISYTKNLEENYVLDLYTFNKLKITFAQLFSINSRSILKQCKKFINEIQNDKTNKIGDIMKTLQPLNDLNNSNNNQKNENKDDNYYYERQCSNFTENLIKQKKRILVGEFVCTLENLIRELLKIKKNIIDMEIEPDYLHKLNDLEKSFFLREKTTYNKNSKIKHLKSSRKTASFGNKNSKFDTEIYIKIYLCSMGSIPYFYAELLEKNKNRSDLEINNSLYDSGDSVYYNNKMAIEKKGSHLNINLSNILSSARNNSNSNSNNNIKVKFTKNSNSMNSNYLNLNNLQSKNYSYQKDETTESYSKLIKSKSNVMSYTLSDFKRLSHVSNLSKHFQAKNELKYNPINKKKTIYMNLPNLTLGYGWCEKINFYLLILSYLSLIFISIFSFFIREDILTHSLDLFKINYFARNTKVSVYYTASSVISGCTNLEFGNSNLIDKNIFNIDELKKEYKLRPRKFLLSMNKFMGKLTEKEQSNHKDIYDLLEKEMDFKILYSDWNFYLRKSNIIKELSYFHYYVSGLQYENRFNICRISQFFHKEKFSEENIISSYPVEDPAKFGEKVMYYIFYNIFQKFRVILEDLTFNTDLTLENHLTESITKVLIINFITLFIEILLIFLIAFSINIYRKRILNLVFEIFLKDKINRVFTKRLKNFIVIATNFKRSNCLEFEEKKNMIFNEEISKFTGSSNPNINNSDFSEDNNKNEKIVNENNKFTSMNINNKLKRNNNKENNNESISINASTDFLNYNQFLNKKETKEKQEKENIENKEKNFIKRFKNLNLVVIKISFIMLSIAFVCYLAKSLTLLLINQNQHKNLLISNKIANNFFERIPKFAELIMYFKISIIANNVNFLTYPQSKYKSSINSDYFNLKFTPNVDTIYTLLNKSEFSHIYYDIFVIRENIEHFMKSLDSNLKIILPSVRKYENKINSKEFCANFLLMENEKNMLFEDEEQEKNIDLLQKFEYLNIQTENCLKIGNGINKFGFNPSLDFFIATIKDSYIDFYRAKDESDMKKTLTDVNFLRSVVDLEVIYYKMNLNYMDLILKDMNDIFLGIKEFEFYFSIIGFIFNCFFIFFIVAFVFKKLQRYYISLNNAMEKFKVALISEKI